MTNRAILIIGSLFFMALWVIGLLIVVPDIEDSLAADANERLEGTGATVEFNGRDGYLAAPADADVETLIEAAAAARGVRDVEFDVELPAVGADDEASDEADGGSQAAAPDDEEDDETDGQTADTTTTTEAPRASAALDLSFDGTAFSGDGVLGASGIGIAGLVADASVDTEAATDLSADQAASLERIVGLFGTDLVDGSVTLVDGQISVTGTAADADAADRIASALADLDGVTADIVTPEPGEEAIQEELEDALDVETVEGLAGIQFDSDTDVIRPESDAVIDELADILSRFPDVAVEIAGHTDNAGSTSGNQALSEARAQAVADALVERGIAGDRLSPVGYGESDPIEDNDTPEGRQANRRVEFTILEDN